MSTHRGNDGSVVGTPPLLTVEEAASLLRIGRTKAYAMAREWRETEGRSGLPVIDLGHVLRVPRQALEEMIGTEFTDLDLGNAEGSGNGRPPVEPPSRQESGEKVETPPQPPVETNRARSRNNRLANQLDLFDSETSSAD